MSFLEIFRFLSYVFKIRLYFEVSHKHQICLIQMTVMRKD